MGECDLQNVSCFSLPWATYITLRDIGGQGAKQNLTLGQQQGAVGQVTHSPCVWSSSVNLEVGFLLDYRWNRAPEVYNNMQFPAEIQTINLLVCNAPLRAMSSTAFA